MKFLIVFYVSPLILALDTAYKGFSSCGTNGWLCTYNKGITEITYNCMLARDKEARVWVWTARLPDEATVFTVRDCNLVDIHLDCAPEQKQNLLTHFNVFNTKQLRFLPTTNPGYYLHNNEKSPRFPPNLHIENVDNVEFDSTTFEKPSKLCGEMNFEPSNFSMTNVHIKNIGKNLMRIELNRLDFRNVEFDNIDENGIQATVNNALILGSNFPNLINHAVQISSRGDVSILNCTFRKVQKNGLTVNSTTFQFGRNYVEDVNSFGFNILSSRIQFTRNLFNHLETSALENVNPGFSINSVVLATKFFYNFSGNQLKQLNPGSLHPNWLQYKDLCTEIVIKNNIFDCSCTNFGWLSVYHGLGPKILKFKEFYELLLDTNDNMCLQNKSCPFKNITSKIQDICFNKTSFAIVCSSPNNKLEKSQSNNSALEILLPHGPALEKTMENYNNVTNKTDTNTITQKGADAQPVQLEEPIEKKIPLISFAENQTAIENKKSELWPIIIPLFIVLLAVSVAISLWWYKKKKQRQIITTVYKSQKGFDCDSLLVINEHSNQIFDVNIDKN